jgi:hypothetical protein
MLKEIESGMLKEIENGTLKEIENCMCKPCENHVKTALVQRAKGERNNGRCAMHDQHNEHVLGY